MSLRELASGNGACVEEGGASSSNPASRFADAVLGGRTADKAQRRTQQVRRKRRSTKQRLTKAMQERTSRGGATNVEPFRRADERGRRTSQGVVRNGTVSAEKKKTPRATGRKPSFAEAPAPVGRFLVNDEDDTQCTGCEGEERKSHTDQDADAVPVPCSFLDWNNTNRHCDHHRLKMPGD